MSPLQSLAAPTLLERTFLHARGVGRSTEQALWCAGAVDWHAYLARPDSNWPLMRTQRETLSPLVLESRDRLAAGDMAWFAMLLPQSEHWRAARSLGDRLLYIDIETNGGMAPEDLTVVGVFDGREMHQFVQGRNLTQFPEVLDGALGVVTFFGTGFDLPFLRRAFPGAPLPPLHIDLCPMLRRLGWKGGLKAIEARLGIVRPHGAAGLSGWDAVRLWQEYRAGRSASLDTLLQYNAEDVRNMAELLEVGYARLARQVLEGS